jgi:hypothetical protein
MNPHPVKTTRRKCPWCDGTGLYARAAYVTKGHHPGCSFKIAVKAQDGTIQTLDSACDGTVEWVTCTQCEGTGMAP